MSRWKGRYLLVFLAWMNFGLAPVAKSKSREDWSTKDSIAAGFFCKLGFVGGAVLGGFIGAKIGGAGSDDDSTFGGLVEGLIGASIGGVLLESSFIHMYGSHFEFDGNYLITALGSLLGTGVSIGLFSLAGQLDSDFPKVLIGIPAAAALVAGPVLGYYFGIKNNDSAVKNPSVVSYSSESGFQLGLPLIQFSKSRTRGSIYHFSLLSGSF